MSCVTWPTITLRILILHPDTNSVLGDSMATVSRHSHAPQGFNLMVLHKLISCFDNSEWDNSDFLTLIRVWPPTSWSKGWRRNCRVIKFQIKIIPVHFFCCWKNVASKKINSKQLSVVGPLSARRCDFWSYRQCFSVHKIYCNVTQQRFRKLGLTVCVRKQLHRQQELRNKVKKLIPEKFLRFIIWSLNT